MAPKIVFSDIDDTLLTRQKELTPRTRAVLGRLAELGIEFVPCTGRALTGIRPEILALDCVHYAVSANGSLIAKVDKDDVRNSEIVASNPIAAKPIIDLYEALKDRDITFDVFIEGQAYAERFRYDRLHLFVDSPAFMEEIKNMRKQVDITIPELLAGRDSLDKAIIFWYDPADRDAAVELIENSGVLDWSTSYTRNIEIGTKGIDKGFALTTLCGHLGIPVEDSVAFGDNLNDLEMIRAAGDGVAMDNALPELKEVADHITLDCDESGVAAYLEDLL